MNVFISALIALYFLRKSSKEVREKTKRASWFRTAAYFILMCITSIMFYKSYQVSTIINRISIEALRGAEDDSSGQSKDTVELLHVYNKFRCLNSYKNDYLEFDNKYLRSDSVLTYNGGVKAYINMAESSPKRIKRRAGLSERVEKRFCEITKRNPSELGPYYAITLLSTNIPSFVPVYPKINYIEPIKQDSLLDERNGKHSAFTFASVYNSRGSDLFDFPATSNPQVNKAYEDLFKNGMVAEQNILLDNPDDSLKNASLSITHRFANTIDILTAADLSQYTYVIGVESDMCVKNLLVEYNIPIEINCSMNGLEKGPRSFEIKNGDLMDGIQNGQCLVFHVKLPTMSNIQQIRSLILTALVTTFFSLFGTNLFYRLRKWAMGRRKSNRLKYAVLRRISRKRIELFKRFHYIMVILLLSLVLAGALFCLFDCTFLMNLDYNIWEKICFVIGLIIVHLVLVCLLYKYAISPLHKKRGKEKILAKTKR